MSAWSSTVNCAEENGSQSESYDDERGIMKASVQLRCAYSDRHLLVADICGNRRAWPKGSAGPAPLAATASIVPVQSPDPLGAESDGTIVYAEALVTINYTTEIKDVVSESLEPTAEFLTLDARGFRWGSGSGTQVKDEEAPGVLVRGLNFVRSELDKTTLDADLLSLVGYVNDSPVTGTILSLTFASETLLYAPPSITYKKDSAGGTKFDVTKKFTWSQHGWNYYYRAAVGSYQRIYPQGSGTPHYSYPLGDLSPLLS